MNSTTHLELKALSVQYYPDDNYMISAITLLDHDQTRKYAIKAIWKLIISGDKLWTQFTSAMVKYYPEKKNAFLLACKMIERNQHEGLEYITTDLEISKACELILEMIKYGNYGGYKIITAKIDHYNIKQLLLTTISDGNKEFIDVHDTNNQEFVYGELFISECIESLIIDYDKTFNILDTRMFKTFDRRILYKNIVRRNDIRLLQTIMKTYEPYEINSELLFNASLNALEWIINNISIQQVVWDDVWRIIDSGMKIDGIKLDKKYKCFMDNSKIDPLKLINILIRTDCYGHKNENLTMDAIEYLGDNIHLDDELLLRTLVQDEKHYQILLLLKEIGDTFDYTANNCQILTSQLDHKYAHAIQKYTKKQNIQYWTDCDIYGCDIYDWIFSKYPLCLNNHTCFMADNGAYIYTECIVFDTVDMTLYFTGRCDREEVHTVRKSMKLVTPEDPDTIYTVGMPGLFRECLEQEFTRPKITKSAKSAEF
jgi:hypothetical protein